MLPAIFWRAKLLPVPSLQYYTCKVRLRFKHTYLLQSIKNPQPPPKLNRAAGQKVCHPKWNVYVHVYSPPATSCGMPDLFLAVGSMSFFSFLFLFLCFGPYNVRMNVTTIFCCKLMWLWKGQHDRSWGKIGYRFSAVFSCKWMSLWQGQCGINERIMCNNDI